MAGAPYADGLRLRADAAARAVIDVSDGMDRVMGNRRLYGRMLRRFHNDYRLGLAPLRAGDREASACFVVSLAGAAGMIGAQALQRQASLLAVALRGSSSSTGAGEDQLSKLDSALGKVLNLLDRMLGHTQSPADAAPQALPSYLALLAQLRDLLRSRDGAAVDLLAASQLSLAAVLGAPALERLAAAMHHFDFELALLAITDDGADVAGP